jgi:hypothetical protein
VFDRFEVIGQRDQTRRFERSPVDAQRVDDRVQIRWGAQREPGMIAEEADTLCRCLLREANGRRITQRLEVCELVVPSGRDREICYSVDDAVEFKRSKGIAVH